jgi:hypothetical protein
MPRVRPALSRAEQLAYHTQGANEQTVDGNTSTHQMAER